MPSLGGILESPTFIAQGSGPTLDQHSQNPGEWNSRHQRFLKYPLGASNVPLKLRPPAIVYHFTLSKTP